MKICWTDVEWTKNRPYMNPPPPKLLRTLNFCNCISAIQSCMDLRTDTEWYVWVKIYTVDMPLCFNFLWQQIRWNAIGLTRSSLASSCRRRSLIWEMIASPSIEPEWLRQSMHEQPSQYKPFWRHSQYLRVHFVVVKNIQGRHVPQKSKSKF